MNFPHSSLKAKALLAPALAMLLASHAAVAQSPSPADSVNVDWNAATLASRSTPTLQVVANPMLERGAKMHDGAFTALHDLGADYVRYVPWLPYPRLAVAELTEPANGKTSWNFTQIDPMVDDFMKATAGHSVIFNFSTLPAWMFKTKEPVKYPDDPNQVTWDYTQGTELRDPSMKESAQYLARVLSWYTQGGFTDEYGKHLESGHHYKIAYWEVLNEIDLEHQWTPETYCRFYDAVAEEMRKVNPGIKFMALALAEPGLHPDMFEYFLNPAHHKAGVPLDFITYHFYAQPTERQDATNWQYTFFDQADGFLKVVRYVESIRKRESPATKTDLDELGVILPEDSKEIKQKGYIGEPEAQGYWNVAGAMYAYLYIESAKLGIDVVGESQLVGYHTQFPSVSMINYDTAAPNARFWVLKLVKDQFGAGDSLAPTTITGNGLAAQAFTTAHGRRLLVVNELNVARSVTLPAELAGASVRLVAPSTGDGTPALEKLKEHTLQMQPFEVAIVVYK